MIRHLLKFALLFSVAAAGQVSYNATVASMMGQITQAGLTSDLNGLTGANAVTVGGVSVTISNRNTGNAVLDYATQWAYERWEAAGLSVSYFPWSSSPYSGRNVIGQKLGATSPTEIVLLIAHVDDYPGPGADDNGTGAVVVMNVCEILAAQILQRTLRCVLFTGEEQGNLGSTTYAPTVAGENIVAVVNLDALGYDGDADNHIGAYLRGGNSGDLAIAATAEDVVTVYSLALTWVTNPNGATNSDHAPFWAAGKSAIYLGEESTNDSSPNFHTGSDTIANMMLPFYTKVAKAVMGTTAHLAGLAASPAARKLAGGHRIGGGRAVR